ncbi:hypothetical protein HMPREF2811_08780 [Globicatella sp. HMSC072A10]|uniref:MerR family transcriptional regulator n=1 Tax=Globicatella sp. HMSC072A10 TaxID=1739315 RepID=UPI0008D12C93|nr:MerR family transcriptional regulator [Globicatella sp. HMSC072A10]OFK52108.1 hypothetical protein HMPREF2811_08780 [Globicatella sp. HMSC072A10]
MKEYLLTISQLGKISQTHVKALRYYQSIGILKPVYVNPDNNYHYYSLAQVTLVQIIKLCTENDVPLKDLKRYLDENGETIALKDLIDYAKNLVENKIAKAQKQLDYINYIQEEIQHSQEIHQQHTLHYVLNEARYWVEPFDGKILSEEYFTKLLTIEEQLNELGPLPIKRIGLLLRYEYGQKAPFICLKLEKLPPEPHPQIITLPEQRNHIEHVSYEDLAQRISQIETQFQPQSIFITETFEDDYDLFSPHLEIQFDEAE